MPSARTRDTLHRAFEAVRLLGSRRYGWRADDLADALRCSRATVYRTFDFLKDVGVVLQHEMVNGEARYRVDEQAPPLQPTPMQVAAIRIARGWLTPLEGTELVRELDALLSKVNEPSRPPPVTAPVTPTVGAAAQINRALDLAIRERRVARILQQSPDDPQAQWRTVEPLEFRFGSNGAIYLVAWDRGRDAIRTFKVMRVHDVQLEDEVFPARTGLPEDPFLHSMGVWSGDLVEVRVRVIPEAAQLVREYPMVESQVEEALPDGSVLIRATVAGMLEPLQWVLGFGAKVEVLAPSAFRQIVVDTLKGALAHYA